MNKKFKLIAPSLAVIFVCLMLIVGSTFAIFTSQDSASIAVTSGKVNMTATINQVEVYSAVENDSLTGVETTDGTAGTIAAGELGAGTYTFVKQTGDPVEINSKYYQLFINKNGGANFTDGELSLRNMTPGDKVKANLVLTNNSNVDIKYRVYCSVATGFDTKLLNALQINVKYPGSNESVNLLNNSAMNWTELAFNANEPHKTLTIPLEVVLPLETGNAYQGLSTKLVFTIQAVQANAKTENLIPTTINITKSVDSNTGTTTVKSTDNSAQAEIPNAALPEIDDDTTVFVNLSVEEKANGNVAVNSFTQQTKSFDVEVTVTTVTNNVAGEPEKYDDSENPITITLTVGTGLVGVQLFHVHDNQTDEITDFTYDSENGTITFSATSFSEYTVTHYVPVTVTIGTEEVKLNPNNDGTYTNASNNKTYVVETQNNITELNTTYGFYNSYKVNANGTTPAHWVHEIKTKAHFQNIMTHIHDRKTLSANDTPLADKDTIYVILNDIDFGGDAYSNYDITQYHTDSFIGNLIGSNENNPNGIVMLSRIGAHTLATTGTTKQYYGLFNTAYYATFENLSISSTTFNLSDTAKPAGIIIGGVEGDNAKAAGTYVKFKNITVDSTCSVKGYSSVGAFAGMLRSIQYLEFENCTNYANVTSSNHSAAGFVGGASDLNNSGHRYFTLKNCYNYGNITAGSSNGCAGGFLGQSQGNSTNHWSLENVENNGNIRVTESSKVSPIFVYHSGSVFGTSTVYEKVINVNNTGMIIVPNSANVEGSFGLYDGGDNTQTNPVLSNGQSITRKQFYDTYVTNIVLEQFEITGVAAGPNVDTSIILDLSNASADLKNKLSKISIRIQVSTNNISYDTNMGSGSSSGWQLVNISNIDVTSWQDTYLIPRLIYLGNTYPEGKDEPIAYIDSNDPTSFRYVFEYNKIANNDEHPRGYHVLDDGTAYFIYDNTNVSSGIYHVTAKFPSMVLYDAQLYDENDVLIGYASIVTDLWPERSLLRISDIPDGVNIVQ